jgi:hypothetical protein
MNEWRAEPSLDELIADPATRLVMAGDHVKEPALRRLLARMGKILGERPGERQSGLDAKAARSSCSER